MKCTICGADNLEGAAYCEDCGSKLPTSPVPVKEHVEDYEDEPVPEPSESPGGEVTCPACGAENPAGSRFCDDCGASLEAGNVGAAVEEAPSPDAGSSKAYAKLVVQDYDRDFVLDKDVITIGRQSPADGIFPDIDLTDVDEEAYVSRRHARILKKDDGFVFEDMGSSNGSFINNVRVAQGVQQFLNDGDVLRLGKSTMSLIKFK
jgi:DNA-directed RNA polymerase subunit RPC12/RpoP